MLKNNSYLTSLQLSSTQKLKEHIQILMVRNSVETIQAWLSDLQVALDEDMVSYLWMQSIRCNQTKTVFPWLYENHNASMAKFKTTMDIKKLMTSPRAWLSLKKEKMVPSMSAQDVARIVENWNKAIDQTSRNFLSLASKEKYRTYFQECADIQIDFLDYFVFSYRQKMTLLRAGLTRQYEHFATNMPTCSIQRPPAEEIVLARTNAMANSNNPDMWALTCMQKKQLGLTYHLSKSNRLSNWWIPMLQEQYPTEFSKDSWQWSVSRTLQRDRPVPDAILVANQLCAGTSNIQKKLTMMLNIADLPQMESFEKIDLDAIDFGME